MRRAFQKFIVSPRVASLPGSLGASVPAISGTAGVWTDVTAAGIDLNNASNGADNFGVQDIVADPVLSGVLYAFICYQGVWRSTDYGATWTKVSANGAVHDGGKPWGAAIAPDGSYLLSMSGGNFTQFGGIDARRQMLKSTDHGATWTAKGDTGGDPYNVAISPYDKTRAVTCHHDTGKILESIDSGETWTDLGVVGSLTASPYVHYLESSDRILIIGQNGEGCYRGTKSGTWSFAAITDLDTALVEHTHGVSQLYYDTVNLKFYLGGRTGQGIWQSSNNGANWTNVYGSEISDCIIGTPTTLYSMRSFPTGASFAPKFTTAPLPAGTSWATATDPAGMTNGPKRFAMVTDGLRYAIVAGCWCGGIWRYIQ